MAHPEERPLDYILICHAPLESTLRIFQLGHSIREFIAKSEHEPLCDENPLSYLLKKEAFDVIDALMPFDILCMINAFDSLGLAPIAEMARDGMIEQAQWLLDHRADVNASSYIRVGSTALDEAVDSHNLEMVRFLLNAGANPNIPTNMSVTAAMCAEIEYRDHKNPKTKEIAQLVAEASKQFPPSKD